MCALVLAAISLTDRYGTSNRSHAAPDVEEEFVSDWRDYATAGPRLGNDDAPVIVVQFSDYQCPACRRLNEALAAIVGDHLYDIQLVHRHLPLRAIHPVAEAAAVAAECADQQGRFGAYHSLLYERQAQIQQGLWREWAEEAGVSDVDSFDRCLTGEWVRTRISADSIAAVQLGARVTPTILINGQ
jgi:protein-disulfide isomerase